MIRKYYLAPLGVRNGAEMTDFTNCEICDGGPLPMTRGIPDICPDCREKMQPVLKKNDCLKTPPEIIRHLGKIDLDPCAGVSTYIGETNYALERGQDGLKLPWFGFVYCNPPFSQKEVWAEKMAKHGNGLLILPERGSAPWFGPLALTAGKYFVMGKKINFIGGPSSNNLGSVFFPFGNEAVERIRNWGLPGHLLTVEFYRDRKKVAMEVCSTCGGSGEVHSHNPKCWDCNGTGVVRHSG